MSCNYAGQQFNTINLPSPYFYKQTKKFNLWLSNLKIKFFVKCPYSTRFLTPMQRRAINISFPFLLRSSLTSFRLESVLSAGGLRRKSTPQDVSFPNLIVDFQVTWCRSKFRKQLIASSLDLESKTASNLSRSILKTSQLLLLSTLTLSLKQTVLQTSLLKSENKKKSCGEKKFLNAWSSHQAE